MSSSDEIKGLIDFCLTQEVAYEAGYFNELANLITTENYGWATEYLMASEHCEIYVLSYYLTLIAEADRRELIPVIDWALKETNDQDSLAMLEGIKLIYFPTTINIAVQEYLELSKNDLNYYSLDKLLDGSRPYNLNKFISAFLDAYNFDATLYLYYLEEILGKDNVLTNPYDDVFIIQDKKTVLDSIHRAMNQTDDEATQLRLQHLSFKLYQAESDYFTTKFNN